MPFRTGVHSREEGEERTHGGVVDARADVHRARHTVAVQRFDELPELELADLATLASASVRKALEDKWLRETVTWITRYVSEDSVNWDPSNTVLLRLELVADELTQADVDDLLDLPRHDSYGHSQLAGMEQFLEYVGQKDPSKLSPKARAWLAMEKPNQP